MAHISNEHRRKVRHNGRKGRLIAPIRPSAPPIPEGLIGVTPRKVRSKKRVLSVWKAKDGSPTKGRKSNNPPHAPSYVSQSGYRSRQKLVAVFKKGTEESPTKKGRRPVRQSTTKIRAAMASQTPEATSD